MQLQVDALSRKRLAGLLVEELSHGVLVIEGGDMTEVFSLKRALNFEGKVLVHLKHSVQNVLVLALVTPLIADDAEHERDNLTGIVGTTLCKVRVDDHSGEPSHSESEAVSLVALEFHHREIMLETFVEVIVLASPVDVFLKVLVSQVIIDRIQLKIAGYLVLTEDVGTDTTEEKAVSALAHF